jgi:hypothetical protein
MTARAGNRRFGRSSALRAHTKPPYKTDLLRKTRRALSRLTAPERPGPSVHRRPQATREAPPPPGQTTCTGSTEQGKPTCTFDLKFTEMTQNMGQL